MIALAHSRVETTAAGQPDGRRTIAELTKTISASRLSTWQRCRLQFYFRYVAGIQKSPTPALHIGTTVHTVLQQWNLARWHGRKLEVQELKEIFSRAWIIWQEGEQIDWAGNEETVKAATWDLIQLYLCETPIAPDEKPEGVEVGVEADLSGHGLPLLVGVIDLVRTGGRIVDFKTSARKPDTELLAHTAETQTTSYGLLYREATGGKENGIEIHHLIKTKQPKIMVSDLGPVTDTQVTRLFRVVEAYLKGVAREDFVPSPGVQCAACEFFNECRAWR
ncbi:MAG TPA: PD-(D/E)XK nuclease family protein [Candidatus Udaeobacter sp.]|jgi:CRISPR/Cas system-associated exonuclease Cas4 (RecB family)